MINSGLTIQLQDTESQVDRLEQAANILLHIATLMLRSGSTCFRAEDVMSRLVATLKLGKIDSYVTPTGVVLTLSDGAHTVAKTRTVPLIGVNMYNICELELLSRRIPPDTTLEELKQRVEQIEKTAPQYPPILVVPMVGLACGCFALILGGGALEALSATTGAIIAQAIRRRLVARHANPYLITAVCATVATLIAFWMVQLTGAPQERIALIASVLLLVPGVPLISALIDLIHMDLISGMARMTYAVLLLINLAVGMLLALILTGAVIL